MPKKMPDTQPREVTADEAMKALGVTTRPGVYYLISAGKLPGARKANPKKRTSVWLIPVASIEAYVEVKEQEKQKRTQAAMA